MAVARGALRRLLPGKAAVSAEAQAASEVQARAQWLGSDADEYFRGIYTRAGLRGGEAIAVCSAIAGEGRTTVALGLATAIARDFPAWRVALVEADPHRPTLALDFGVAPSPGLAEVVQATLPIESSHRATGLENLRLLPVGGPIENASLFLRSSQLAAALVTLRQAHDILVLDLPALLIDSAVLPLASQTDGVLFVVRAGQTPRSLVERALTDLGPERVRGIVLNGVYSDVPGWLGRLVGLDHG